MNLQPIVGIHTADATPPNTSPRISITYPNFAGNGSPEGVQVANIGQTYEDVQTGMIFQKVYNPGLDTGWGFRVDAGVGGIQFGNVDITNPSNYPNIKMFSSYMELSANDFIDISAGTFTSTGTINLDALGGGGVINIPAGYAFSGPFGQPEGGGISLNFFCSDNTSSGGGGGAVLEIAQTTPTYSADFALQGVIIYCDQGIALINDTTGGIQIDDHSPHTFGGISIISDHNSIEIETGSPGNSWSGEIDIFTSKLLLGVGAGQIGFYGVTPVSQYPAITAPTGGTTIDTQSRTAIGSIINTLTGLGLIA